MFVNFYKWCFYRKVIFLFYIELYRSCIKNELLNVRKLFIKISRWVYKCREEIVNVIYFFKMIELLLVWLFWNLIYVKNMVVKVIDKVIDLGK